MSCAYPFLDSSEGSERKKYLEKKLSEVELPQFP